MAVTQIDIDDDALAEAMRLSGARTKKETVNLALREFSERHRRVAALEHYASLAAGWDHEAWQRQRAADKGSRSLIRYLIHSSALWRILREPGLRAAWAETLSAAAIGSCAVQRTEFRRSARSRDEYDQMSEMFSDLYPDVGTPKSLWQWVESAQHRLVRAGSHRAASAVDLAVAGIAAVRGLVVLHDDGDMVTLGLHLTDVRERRVRDLPSAS